MTKTLYGYRFSYNALSILIFFHLWILFLKSNIFRTILFTNISTDNFLKSHSNDFQSKFLKLHRTFIFSTRSIQKHTSVRFEVSREIEKRISPSWESRWKQTVSRPAHVSRWAAASHAFNECQMLTLIDWCRLFCEWVISTSGVKACRLWVKLCVGEWYFQSVTENMTFKLEQLSME